LERFADDLLRVLAAAEVDRCHYVGHSIGAIIGMLASIARPEKFERLILIGASPCYLDRPGYKGGFTPETLNAMLDPITRNYQAWVEGLSQLAVGAGPDDPATMDFGRSLLAMRPEIALAVLNVVLRSDMRERLPEVTVPAVIVQTRDDPAVPMAVAEHLWDKLAGSVLEVIDAHGHLPHLSAPEKVVGVLEKHLPGLGHHG
jgi:sigma-B regulation protein RsbQ